MIKANEIRLGNYLLTPKEQIFTVKAIDFDRLHDENGEYIVNHFSLHKCKPIELNEDILVKCGFVQTSILSTFEKEEFSIENWDNNEFIFRWNDFTISVDLKYLHTLQNLIFALTGEELNIIL